MIKFKRLGIVATLLYMLTFSFYGVYSYYESSLISTELKSSTLFVKYKKSTDIQKSNINTNRKTRYITCMNNATIKDKRICGAVFLFEPNYIKSPNLWGIILVFILIPAFSWLVLLGSTSLFRWILNGSETNKTSISQTKDNLSFTNHYLGIFAFGWLYSLIIDSLILSNSLTIYSISGALGGGIAFIFLGWVFTLWKGIKVGWIAVFILAFFIFIGSTSQL